MPGPPPKHASKRRRVNATVGVVRLPAASKVKAPPLPLKGASKAARDWWSIAWASPMASVWLEADVPGLVRLASLVDRVAKGDAPMTVLTEIRALEDRFGLSPLARRRLEWEIESTGSPVEANGSKGDDARWRRASV
jgi:hypothetical protein